MPEILLGVVVLALGLWAVNAFSKIDPKLAARLVRSMGGIGALLFAVFLLLRGEFGPAALVGLFGLGLLGYSSQSLFGKRSPRSSGKTSRVRTNFIEMELDHDTGAMRGSVLAGRYAGNTLEALDRAALLNLFAEADDDSRQLLATYLDRREPGWRENAQGDAGAGSSGPGASRGGKMTEEEAYQILGIQAGASAEDISRAHRSLMKKLHPDQGGTTYLAARVNEAKDVLLRRHR
jgi:hypothetical protein